MDDVKIIKIKPEKVKLYNPNNKYLGLVNELEFNEIRIQIAEKQLEGYYIKYKKNKTYINKKGDLEEWPNGLWTKFNEQFGRLHRLKKSLKLF